MGPDNDECLHCGRGAPPDEIFIVRWVICDTDNFPLANTMSRWHVGGFYEELPSAREREAQIKRETAIVHIVPGERVLFTHIERVRRGPRPRME